MSDLTVLIVGSGAREHTLSQAYEKSNQVGKIIVAPGNDFISFQREKEVITDGNCSLKDPNSFLALATNYKPDLVDVAPDDALALGTVDLLQQNGFLAFGPTRRAARIEGNKEWSRRFMERHQIPSPDFHSFDSGYPKPIREFLRPLYKKHPEKLVFVKAAGLCGGKGALKATNLDEAFDRVSQMKSFGEAGRVFLIEEGLVGEEFSSYAISDGESYFIFNSAQDNKRALDFDRGDQTGGMGAISPAMITEPISSTINSELISKAISGMSSEGTPYKGILYLGGIVEDDTGEVKVIEYNARWGDPEVQAVLPSVQTDYLDIVMACLHGGLKELNIEQDDKTRVCVVGASRGYPRDYSKVKGKQIHGLEEAMQVDGVEIFGAGIKVKDNKFYADGGRLFSVVGEGIDVVEAKQKAYSAIAYISIEGDGLHYRTDIGRRDVERFNKNT